MTWNASIDESEPALRMVDCSRPRLHRDFGRHRERARRSERAPPEGHRVEPTNLFLIAARAMSHGTQLVSDMRHEELDVHSDAALSARKTLEALFRPGSLAIIVDAIGITVLLGTAPFNTKLRCWSGFFQ